MPRSLLRGGFVFPFIPVYLEKNVWIIIDYISAGLFFVYIVFAYFELKAED